jgi:hypothetical protein
MHCSFISIDLNHGCMNMEMLVGNNVGKVITNNPVMAMPMGNNAGKVIATIQLNFLFGNMVSASVFLFLGALYVHFG